MELLLKFLVSAAAIYLTARLLSGVQIKSFGQAIVTAILLALVNTFLKPILIVLTIPITILTLGLFLLVINALLIYLISAVSTGFKVKNFGWAFLFSIVLSVVQSLLEWVVL
jgi:putative membrane protein